MWLSKRMGVLVAALIVVHLTAVRAQASPIIFASVSPDGGSQVLQFDTSTLALSSVAGATVIYQQLTPAIGPLSVPFAMTPLTSPTSVPGAFVYGPGSFSLGLLDATFSALTLDFGSGSVLVGGTATFSNVAFDAAQLTGLLSNPGAFGFNLLNPQVVPNPAGAPTALSYQISGALAAQPVPEPSVLVLLATGLLLVVALPVLRQRLSSFGS